MEPTLVVIGLSHRTAPVEIRERYWMGGCRQAEALSMLSQAEGIDEVVLFSTCNRTEFMLWGDPTLAVNTVLRFLTSEYDLKLANGTVSTGCWTSRHWPMPFASAADWIP